MQISAPILPLHDPQNRQCLSKYWIKQYIFLSLSDQSCFFSFAFKKLLMIGSLTRIRCFPFVTFGPYLRIWIFTARAAPLFFLHLQPTILVSSDVVGTLLGSLSNHDGDGSENVIRKCNFAFLQSFFNYSNSLSLKYVFQLSWN